MTLVCHDEVLSSHELSIWRILNIRYESITGKFVISLPNYFNSRVIFIMCHLLQDSAQTIPWKLLLSKAPVWALIVSHFCHNWGTFILLTWMPTYYNQVTAMLKIVPVPVSLRAYFGIESLFMIRLVCQR